MSAKTVREARVYWRQEIVQLKQAFAVTWAIESIVNLSAIYFSVAHADAGKPGAAEIRKHEPNRDGGLKSSDGALALRLTLFLGKLVPSLLNKALGTGSSDFTNACMFQIQAAARSPFGTISETAMNAALAMIAAAAPKDEIEAALAVQMSCTHAVSMAILGKLDSGFGTERRIAAYATAAARLMKTFTMQAEVFRRLRQGGHQYVHVEHVHVNEGGQAVIGNVKRPDTQG